MTLQSFKAKRLKSMNSSVCILENGAYVSKYFFVLKQIGQTSCVDYNIKKKVNMEAIELPCIKLLPTACIPTCAMPRSVGLDLYSPTSVLVPAHDKVLVNMGNCFSNSHGLLWSNSP